jgi:hypothetical protein
MFTPAIICRRPQSLTLSLRRHQIALCAKIYQKLPHRVSALSNSERLYKRLQACRTEQARYSIATTWTGRTCECGVSAIELSKPLTKLVPSRRDPKFNNLRQTPQMF